MHRYDEVVSPIACRHTCKHRHWPPAIVAVVPLLVSVGCSSTLDPWNLAPWIADYDAAEQRADESGREMLIVYRNTRPGADHSIEEILKTPRLDGLTRSYVRCLLFKSYEPDRRYVAQFGVQRAPALIVVHRDGTYHARSGTMSTADVAAFLADSQAPGQEPVVNPYIPRKPRYQWRSSFDEAETLAQRTDRPIVVVLYRTGSRDWPRLKRLLARHEVYSRLADMVHCRIGLFRPFADGYVTRFGTLKLPAIVIAHPDGTYDVLELPTSYETVARFVDAARRQQRASAAASPMTTSP